MSKSTIGLRRTGLAALATTSLVMGAAFAGAGIASADEDFAFERVAGDNRYETSAEIADRFGDATTAILASGEEGHYPDSLSANFLAGTEDAPVLLTMENDTPQSVLDQLADSGIENVIIVGGNLAVSDEQEQALKDADYNVSRVSGQTRFDTNAAIIEAGQDNDSSDTALVATAWAFPDALAGGPAAFKQGMPIALADKADVPDAVIDALKAANVNKAIILGGELRVPKSVEADLEANGIDVVTRLAGQSRSATSVEIAEYALANWGFVNTGANVASGRAFGEGADALAGGPLTGEQARPLLITENENVAGSVDDYLADHANTLTDGIIFGGLLAITQTLENALEAAAQSVTSNQDFTVTPAESATLTWDNDSTTETGDQRQYSVTGLAASTDYVVRLFPADNVTEDANGVVTFADELPTAAGDSNADEGDVAADIVVVNGGTPPLGTTNEVEVQAVNGQITFTIDGDATESVVPVVYNNAEGDENLDLDANNRPTEEFGVGGVTKFVPAEAATADFDNNADDTALVEPDDGEISEVGDGWFIAEDDGLGNLATDALYEFDANDTYYIEADASGAPGFGVANIDEQVTLEKFVAELSAGDNILGESYRQNEAFQSQFLLFDDSPAAPNTTVGTETATTIPLSIDGVVAGASVEIFLADGTTANYNTDPSEFEKVATVTKADDANTADADIDYTITVPGDDAVTDYRVATRQVVNGEASTADNDDAQTPAVTETVRPTLTNTELTFDDATLGLVDQGDVMTFEFSENMADDLDTAGTYLRLSDGDSTYQVVCEATAAPNTVTPAAGTACQLTAGGEVTVDDDMLTVQIGTDAGDLQLVSGEANGLDHIGGTVTVSLVSPDWDDQAGNQLDLAGSADRIVDVE